MSDKASNSPPPHWLLHRADQAAVALLVAIALGATVGWWVAHGGLSGRLVEVERAEPQTARFQVDVNRADWPELAQPARSRLGAGAPDRRLPAHRRAVRRSRGPAAAGARTGFPDARIHPTVSVSDAPQKGSGGEMTLRAGRAEDGVRADYFGRLFCV